MATLYTPAALFQALVGPKVGLDVLGKGGVFLLRRESNPIFLSSSLRLTTRLLLKFTYVNLH